MDWINYHHLLYFWTVCKEGSIARACERLRLSQPTISGQLRTLEHSFGEKLFTRSGRGLKLTEFGAVVCRYADEIFTLGQELTDVVKGRPVDRPSRLLIGVSDALPKLVAFRLIEPALKLGQPIRMICHEGKTERLVISLASNELDLVLADAPVGPGVKIRAFSHLLGECGVSFLASPPLATAHRRRFPKSLNGAPMLLPDEDTMLRRSLEQWFHSEEIRPAIMAEFDDNALMTVFAQAGTGIFATPSAFEAEVVRQYNVRPIGHVESIRERFYVITLDRKIKHPAIAAITESARKDFFS